MAKHLIALKDLKPEEIKHIIDRAIEIKKWPDKYSDYLDHKNLAIIFQKTSTRTHVSFESGMTQLGGHAIYLDWMKTQFIMSEIKDEIRAISRYVDIIMARLLKNKDLVEMARYSRVPVINGLNEKYHPCQILGDLMTLKEKFGKLEGLKLVYFGVANNISNSLTVGCLKTGMNFVLCSPERHQPSLDNEITQMAKKSKFYSEEKIPKKAVKNADVVYTDTWVDMELFFNPKFAKEKERRLRTFLPYQVNKKLLGNSKALIMHDMPMHVGYEITRDIIESKKSIIFDQAENRLHVQKAIMLYLLGLA
jgi:ornithine carbamoyltransferase